MTLQEFKAWFEGFTENMKGVPTQKQWARIQERVGQIDGIALTKEVIYRYWPTYSSIPGYTTWCTGTTTNAVSTKTLGNTSNTACTLYNELTLIGGNEYKECN